MNQIDNGTAEFSIFRNNVYQSNLLIDARKNFDLTGMKIFLLGLQGLNPHFSTQDKLFDKNFKEIFVPAAKLTAVFGNTWYLSEIKSACEKMFGSTIEVDHPNGKFELGHLFRRLEYVPSEGLYVWFDDILNPYILNLLETQGYTQIDAASIFKLSSPYAIRLLEIMLQYRNVEKFKVRREITREIKLNDLRFMLNVPENAYQGRLNNFRRFVLDNPIRQINERTDYKLSYKTLKSGRKVIGFEFKLDMKLVRNTENPKCKPQFANDAIETLRSLGFTDRVARAIFGKCVDVDDCFSRINRAQALLARSKTPIRNRAGFLRKAIEEDWRIYGDKRKPKKFVNVETPVTPETPVIKAPSTMSLAQIFAPVRDAISKAPPPENESEYETPDEPNKYNIPAEVMKNIKAWITADSGMATVELVLSTFGLTVEQFRKEFMSQ